MIENQGHLAFIDAIKTSIFGLHKVNKELNRLQLKPLHRRKLNEKNKMSLKQR